MNIAVSRQVSRLAL